MTDTGYIEAWCKQDEPGCNIQYGLREQSWMGEDSLVISYSNQDEDNSELQ